MNWDLLASGLQVGSGWVWQTSLAATVLIAVVWAVQFVFQKVLTSRWQYALWLLVVARLMLPAAPSSDYSIQKLFQVLQRHNTKTVPVIAQPAHRTATQIDSAVDVQVPAPLQAVETTRPLGQSRWNYLGAAPYVWFVGVLTYLLVVIWQHRRLACWVRRQQPVKDPHLLALIQECKKLLGVKREFEIIISNSLGTPSLFGVFRPRLLLPKSMLGNFADLRLVLLHELVHLKGRHVLQNWLLIGLQALHWFNPAVWLAFKRLRADRELFCDAKVLACLTAEERHAYGAALINLSERLSQPFLAPTLVPIINHKHQIHRRITMIAQFRATPWLLTISSALLLVGIGSFTFTRAAEKQTKDSDRPPAAEPAPEHPRIKVLQRQLEEQGELVREAQRKVDTLKEHLVIASVDETESGGNAGQAPTVLHRLEILRIEAQSAYQEIQTLYSRLTNMNRADLKKAIVTASPDPILIRLFEHLTLAEQKVAEASEMYGSNHPEVKRAKRLLNTIQAQVDERIDGILEGLKTKTAAYKARMDSIRQEAEQTKKMEIERAIKLRPYFEAKRELETRRGIQERLQLRLLQEKVDSAEFMR